MNASLSMGHRCLRVKALRRISGMARRRAVTWPVCLLILLACGAHHAAAASGSPPQNSSAQMRATQVEDRSHLRFADPAMAHAQVRKLVLANGMRVYLLHDPTAKTDAVACGVRAGSWQDPPDAPGMAHFVEHLLFMGTAQYPDEADFYAYLARHGGNTNAYTTVDRTVYMFDVASGGLTGSLLRFGAFFKHPLLRDASIARERQAVDQEFRAKERLDGWRELMVDAALSKSSHPNRYFHIGTQQSLGQVDHRRMADWFAQHYSAHLMDVVVRGAQSLDTLQAAVIAAFGDVPKRDIDALTIATPLLDPTLAGSTVVIEPIKARTRELSVKWDLPIDVGDKPASWACDALAYVLDSQGPQSLLAHLRAQGLAEDISILPRHFASGRTLLTVTFDVTDAGVTRRNEVLALFFAALDQYRDVPRLLALMRELQDQTWRQYAYQSPGPGYDAVAKTADQMLTENLQTFPDVKVPDFHLDKTSWQQLLAQLTSTAAHVTLLAPASLAGIDPAVQRVEPRMQTRYTVLPQSVPQTRATVAPGFGIPEVNPWMPQQFAVAHAAENAPTLAHPQHFVDDAYASIFVARDRHQTNPRLSLTVDIKTPSALADDAFGEALFDLWWQAVDDQLQGLRNDAEAAGLHLKVEPIEGGVRVGLHGFGDKAPQLLEVVLQRLTHVGSQITHTQFEALRTRQARVYDDQSNARPRDLAYATLFDWRMGRVYAVSVKKAALQTLQPADLAQAAQQVFAQTYTQASLFGNVDMRTAYACYASINRHLRHTVYAEGRQKVRRSRDMCAQALPARIWVPTNSSRGQAMVLQMCEGTDTPEAKAVSSVLSVAIEPRFFDVLRTHEQTAYSLSTSGISREGQLFRTFSVSPFHVSARAAGLRVDAFLQRFAQGLEAGDVGEAEFLAYKAVVRKQWTADADQVVVGNERLHWLAFERRGDFSLVQQRLEALDRLDYKTFLERARAALMTQHRVEVFVEGPNYSLD